MAGDRDLQIELACNAAADGKAVIGRAGLPHQVEREVTEGAKHRNRARISALNLQVAAHRLARGGELTQVQVAGVSAVDRTIFDDSEAFAGATDGR